MKVFASGVVALLLAGGAAVAGPASGNGALALAALVAEHSPLVAAPDKAVLGNYLNGRAGAPHPRGLRIIVSADTVRCRASNVDIAAHSCELTFRSGAGITLNGRAAHELYATLAEIGVEPDGAAGSMYEAVSHLKCTVSTDEVAERGGGGANCTFETN